MPSDVFWAAVIAGSVGLASNIPTYLVARFGHAVQRDAIVAESQRLAEQHRQQERREGVAFQRETLIQLQDWMAKLTRATGALNHRDEMEFRLSGTWGRQRVGEPINTEHHEATQQMNRYRVRVLDDQIRADAERLVWLCVAAAIGAHGDEDDASARDNAAQTIHEMGVLTGTLNDRIGQRLRELLVPSSDLKG